MSERVTLGGRTFEVIDLSQHMSNDTSAFEPMPHQIEYVDHHQSVPDVEGRLGLGAEYWPNGEVWAYERVTLTTHSGTHIDAPYHYAPSTTEGSPARTIDRVPLQWVMSDGFVLEMMHCDRRAGITERDVRTELERIAYEPKENDIALVRTDTSLQYREAGYDLLHAGLRREATAWLVEHGVRLIGIDAWGIDRAMDVMAQEAKAGDKPQLWESHKYGAEHEYSQIEKLSNLAAIPWPHGFQVLALPVALERASAAWARVVAMFELPAGE
jgi:kynurenine formamidase